jgi:hypothetical protein
MKKLILLTFITFLSLSCSNDDDSQSVSIEGNWTIEKTGIMDSSNEVTSEEDWSHDCLTNKNYIILNSLENFTFNYFSSACEATFFGQQNGTYSLNSANGTLVISGGTDWDNNYTIIRLTERELILRHPSFPRNVNNFTKFSRRN